MKNMEEHIAKLRDQLNKLMNDPDNNNKVEVLKLSRELDELIYLYYKDK